MWLFGGGGLSSSSWETWEGDNAGWKFGQRRSTWDQMDQMAMLGLQEGRRRKRLLLVPMLPGMVVKVFLSVVLMPFKPHFGTIFSSLIPPSIRISALDFPLKNAIEEFIVDLEK